MNFLSSTALALLIAGQALSISPARIDAEMAADADVLRSLSENGDVPDISRPVDVRFVGRPSAIAKLEADAASLGWRVVQKEKIDRRETALDVQRDQTTDAAAIRKLTEAALLVEARYGVRYDGWGSVATKH